MGATGLVGTEMLRILEERAFPVSELRAYASARSLGPQAAVRGRRGRRARCCAPGCFDGLDLVIVDVDDPLAAEWAPQAAAAGAQRRRQLGRVPHGPRRPARDRRGESRRPALAAEGHRVVPELHDDDPGHRARAAAPRRAHRPPGRVDVPVGVGRGPGRPARARRAVDEARRPRARSCAARARSTRRSSRARCGRSRSRAT